MSSSSLAILKLCPQLLSSNGCDCPQLAGSHSQIRRCRISFACCDNECFQLAWAKYPSCFPERVQECTVLQLFQINVTKWLLIDKFFKISHPKRLSFSFIQGWVLLKLLSLISPQAKFSIWQTYLLEYLNHVYIWQVPNMNVIYKRVFWQCWNFQKIAERGKIGLVTATPGSFMTWLPGRSRVTFLNGEVAFRRCLKTLIGFVIHIFVR